jgi:hypothetical protein
MKELAIAMMYRHFPQFEFMLDLHDGIFFTLPEEQLGDDHTIILEAREMLNNLPYEKAWGWKPSVPITWDAAIGPDWGHMKEIK